MAKDKNISDLPEASALHGSDIAPIVQVGDPKDVTKRTTVDNLGTYIATSIEVASLNTTDKHIAGAINEVLTNVPTIDAYTKSETNELLADKADKSDTYTKSQVDTALDSKADKSTTYTKTEVDTALAAKADATDLASKADVSQIIIKDGAVTFVGLPYPQPDSYTPFSMWFEMRNVNNDAVYAWTEPNTSSQSYSFESGTIIDVIDQVNGEAIDGVTTWSKFEDSSRGTLYVNGYYIAPLYRVDFNYPVAGEIVSKFKVYVKPYQFGAGYPQPNNFRSIHTWYEMRVKRDDTIYEISLPHMVGGWVELADGDGSGSNDYGYIDMGDLQWTATSDSAIFYAAQDSGSDPLDFEAPSDTSDIADIYCTSYRVASQDTVEGKVTDNTICGMSPNNGIEIYSTAFIGKTASWVRTALSGYKLAYKSTTPTTFTFSGQTHLTGVLESKVGENRIYADCGNISECCLPRVRVPADTVILTGTLTAGQTTVALQSAAITDDAMYDLYTDAYGVNPTAASVESGVLTLTFEEQSEDVGVKVVIH